MEKNNCPNCGRSLTEDEMYCYFCEMSVEELRKKGKKHPNNSRR